MNCRSSYTRPLVPGERPDPTSYFLMRLSDDIIEHIIDIRVDVSFLSGEERLLVVIRLSQLCRRVRLIVLSRGSFWNHIRWDRQEAFDATPLDQLLGPFAGCSS